jgi:hypothetical protein
MDKKCIKTQGFFYRSVTANLSAGWTAFRILVSCNVRLGPSKTSSLSNVAPDFAIYI